MKNFIFIFSFLFIFTSCVSRSAYSHLQKQQQNLSEENAQLIKNAAQNERALQKLQDEYKALKTYSTETIADYQKSIAQLEKDLQHTQFALQQSNKSKDSLLHKNISLEKGVLQANANIYKSLQEQVLKQLGKKINSELNAKHIALTWEEKQWDNEQFPMQLKAILTNLKTQSQAYEKLTLVFSMPSLEQSNWLNKAAQVTTIIKDAKLENNIEFLFKTPALAMPSADNNTALHLFISSNTDKL